MQHMRIAIRCDWGPGIGLGHLGRCTAIARAAMDAGHEVTLVANAGSGPAPEMANGIRVHVLDVGHERLWNASLNPDSTSAEYMRYEQLDARLTATFLDSHGIDSVLVDHYFLGNVWNSTLSPSGVAIHVIDDIDRRWNSVESLVDPRPGASRGERTNGTPRVYLGLRYYPATKLAAIARHSRRGAITARSVLVFTGGADMTGLTLRYVDVLGRHRNDFEMCKVIVGRNTPDREEVMRQLSAIPWVEVDSEIPDIAREYSEIMLVLGAGGISVYERCCIGTPQVAASISENQVPQCVALEQMGCLIYAGSVGDVDERSLSAVVGVALRDVELRDGLSDNSRRNVDEYGAGRLALLLFGTDENPAYRPCEERDIFILFQWVNDRDVRANAVDTSPIEWSDHRRWFEQIRTSTMNHIWIMELDGVPVAQVRLDSEGEAAIVSYSVDSDFRGRGFGRLAVEHAVDTASLLGFQTLRAVVRRTNSASMRIFESVGFFRQDDETGVFTNFSLRLNPNEDRGMPALS